MNTYDTVIVGAGPGGLNCARILAQSGVKTLVVERRKQIGQKVCAGGITWRGLIRTVPDKLIEHTFTRQVITTRYQRTCFEEPSPIVATINRESLGNHMLELAEEAGAEVITDSYADTISDGQITIRTSDRRRHVHFDYLVGADGSGSRVRHYLGLPSNRTAKGIGINYKIRGCGEPDMIWNFDSSRFGSGYSWIFPHGDHASIGAYVGIPSVSANQLKNGLDRWITGLGIDSGHASIEADLVNWDYRGWRFGTIFLVGDAAGLASPLTGEGINPAFVSGECVARTIIDPNYRGTQLETIIKRHRNHKYMLKTASKSRIISTVLSEMSAVLLRYRLLHFKHFEMA